MDSCIARIRISSRNTARVVRRTSFVFSRGNSSATKAKSTPAPSKTQPEAAGTELTWPKYLAIKRSKRTWQTAVAIPSSLAGLVGGALYFGNMDTDPTKLILGIDPFFFYGFCTVGTLGLGALIGPSIGTALWRSTHRRLLPQIDAKDREFFRRVAKNRVDASLQSPAQPVPDYYGEKIGSLHQYRQWLRDQAKYKRKALLPEE